MTTIIANTFSKERIGSTIGNKGFEIAEVDDPIKLNVRCRGHCYELQSYF